MQLLEKRLFQVNLPVQPHAALVELTECCECIEANVSPPLHIRYLPIAPFQVLSQQGEFADEVFEGNCSLRTLPDQMEEAILDRVHSIREVREKPRDALVVTLRR